ncbi:protein DETOXIFICATION 48 isoform X1 [Lathyrus oleraceus]|uniref:Protein DETOXIFICATION n=1 Tax=Pisum sativum TaxID=3888 RepID=A0A9D4Y9Q2_PEA|nr:protein DETOXIFICATION 48-like isoform X1 [Pisum sativum]KAI5435422.1 Protein DETOXIFICATION 48 [Pisum sativum]
MCNPKPSSPTSPFLSPTKTHTKVSYSNPTLDDDHVQDEFHSWPSLKEALTEIKEIGKISGPTTITGLLIYSRAMISMIFLGYLGEMELAGGSLSIGFANITGYSVISGLAMGMEPICGQAYGAKQWKILGLTLQRTVLLLLSTSIPISFIWSNMKTILLFSGQDQEISSMAQTFILYSIPDLFLLSFLHPLRIYLRTQGITLPLTYCSAVSVLLHVPLNFLLVVYFEMGIAGVSIAMVLTNLNLVILLSSFLWFSRVYKDSWISPSLECVKGWSSLLSLAIPTCVSVCLEWWWYEFMIMMCGLLINPKATIASMGILIQTTSLVYVFPSSLSLGVSTRIGNELGANRPQKARISMIVSLFVAMVLGLGAMLFTTLMRNQWGKFFTSDKEILELTSIVLPIVGLCELGNCPQTTGCGVLRGSARPTIGANINLGSFYLVGMPVAIFLGFVAKLGFAGLWIGLLAAQGSCAMLMLIVLCRTDWNVEVQRAKELTRASTIKTTTCDDDNDGKLPTFIETKMNKNNVHDCLEEIVITHDEKDPLIITTTTTTNYIED